jgi:nitroreductase
METMDAILTRRSVPKTEGPGPDKATILRLLDAAVRAPNHRLTQPWRFVVLTGLELQGLGEAWAAGTERAGKDPAGISEKALRAPVVVAVIERPNVTDNRVIEMEEHHAVGAAMQNFLLAAHDMGLGAMLRTGPAATMPEVTDFLELKDGEFVAGLIYLGHPLEGSYDRPMTRRKPAAELTEWRGWD